MTTVELSTKKESLNLICFLYRRCTLKIQWFFTPFSLRKIKQGWKKCKLLWSFLHAYVRWKWSRSRELSKLKSTYSWPKFCHASGKSALMKVKSQKHFVYSVLEVSTVQGRSRRDKSFSLQLHESTFGSCFRPCVLWNVCPRHVASGRTLELRKDFPATDSVTRNNGTTKSWSICKLNLNFVSKIILVFVGIVTPMWHNLNTWKHTQHRWVSTYVLQPKF